MSHLPAQPTHESVLMLIRDLVHERTGIFFDNASLQLMADKLDGLVATQASAAYLDFYYRLKGEPETSPEWREVINLFSVQETYFWREIDQIRYFVDRIVPDWFAATSAPLTVWSAACASGEEPYSIAMALDAAGWGHHPIRIHASDASDKALQKAASALYRERAFRLLPEAFRRQYFEEQPKGWKLNSQIAGRVTFQWMNLVTEDNFDRIPDPQVIFCRNVFIYFSPISIAKAVRAFARRMSVGGYLFVGATESLLRLTDRFELRDLGTCFAYKRTPSGS
ncbi:MAG: protein-glutamate O-methyltransferase CheR [Verrucomicrobiales bacterium]|nr:protein-glutamate O-methyltransferase CheR [Verrucomicrobiales bacterium]